MPAETAKQFFAEIMVHSWDQHIGEDGAGAIMRELEKAGLVLMRKEPPGYMNGQAKANWRMVVYSGSVE